MTKREFAVWAAALQTYFPRFKLLPNAQAMDLWFQELEDMPAELLTTALRKWVVTEKWPPTIAEIRAQCAEIVNGKAPDWGEAWREVMEAIRRYGYMQPEKAFAAMSPLTRKTVERVGWYDLNMTENVDTVRAQFRQVFEIVARREAEDRQLPDALKETIDRIGQGSVKRIGGAHDGNRREIAGE